MALDWKAWAALVVFVFQNAAMALLMRWNKSVAPVYSNAVAVLMQEFAVKLPLSFLLYSYDMGWAPMSSIRQDLRERSDEWIKLSIPALLYTVQNIMLYVGYANLEAAVGMVTYQTKIVFTALCTVMLLGKRLSVNQWIAVVILTLGIVCVQGIFDATSTPQAGSPPPPPELLAKPVAKPTQPRASRKRHKQGRVLLDELDGAARALSQASGGHHAGGNVTLGLTAMLVASACTSFASVYFEKMLKSDSKPNLWLRNIQLAGYSSMIAYLTIVFHPDPTVVAYGWFHNFGFNAWLSVYMNALGGLLVAVTIKYADNILRGFAQALAIIMGAVGSHFIFGSTFGPSFMLGVALVITSVFLYGSTAKSPMELCARAC